MIEGCPFGLVAGRVPGPFASINPFPGADWWFDPTSGVSASGGSVSTWTDRIAAIVASGGVSPTFGNTVNGLPVVTCNASQYLLANACAAIANGTSKAFTLVCAVRPTTVAANGSGRSFCGFSDSATNAGTAGSGSGWSQIYVGTFTGNLQWWRRNNAGSITFNNPSTASLVANTPYVLSYVYNGTQISAYRNGTLVQTLTAQSGGFGCDSFSLGAFYADGSIQSGHTGDVMDIVGYGSALTTGTVRADAENVLRAKWGTA